MKFYILYFCLILTCTLKGQTESDSCKIKSVYYQMAYVADLELKTFNRDVFNNRRPENSWTYEFDDGLITSIKFDPTLGGHRSAKIKYDKGRIVEILYDGGLTTKREYVYDESGELSKSVKHSIFGIKEKRYKRRNDTLLMISWNEEKRSEHIEEIVLNDHYKNLTFPFSSAKYFDEHFTVQSYYETDGFRYERISDVCGNTTAIMKIFNDGDDMANIIQQIKYFEIEYE